MLQKWCRPTGPPPLLLAAKNTSPEHTRHRARARYCAVFSVQLSKAAMPMDAKFPPALACPNRQAARLQAFKP
jgi:hypothetical protein